MTTTETDSIQLPARPSGAEQVWRLTIVRHPDPGLVGIGAPVGEGAALGRSSDFLVGALDHGRVSREHAQLDVMPGGGLRLRDLGSRNGTTVDGDTVDGEREVTAGAVVGMGPVLLLLHRGPRYFTERAHATVWSVSHAMARVLELTQRAAREGGNVVLLGETGVGKEVVAQALHDASNREGKLVAVNCAAVSDGVLQSELFGHERGAFSGAEVTKVGLVEAADRGTLFLDEIASASPALQAALLRVLQDGVVRRVGATFGARVDVCFVAALLEREARQAAAIRDDLWFRLARRAIHIPPLRERREDIVYLAQRFAGRVVGEPVRLGRHLAWQLLAHPWPGNVRELQGTIEALVTDHPPTEANGVLELDGEATLSLPVPPDTANDSVSTPMAKPKPTKRPPRARLEALLEQHEGQIAPVARELGVPRKSVYRWLDALDIDAAPFREGS